MTTPITTTQTIVSFDVGIRNLAYCIIVDNKVTHWAKEDLGCKRNDMQGLMDALIRLLNTIVETEIDLNTNLYILIEQQMTSTMKCIQTAIAMYFKTFVQFKKEVCKELQVHYVSPKLKLTYIASHPDFVPPPSKSSSKYNQNKADAVAFTTWYLDVKEPDPVAMEVLKQYKKKDDIADVFLQGIAWQHLRLKPYKVSERK